MALRFDEPWLIATVLLWARIGALFMASPLFSASRMPAPFIVIFTLVLAGVLTGSHELRAPAGTGQSVLVFAIALTAEVIIGLVLGFAIQCAVSAFALAGQVLDVQLGMGMGAIFNPVMRSSSPVIASTLALFAVAYFFAVDAHLAVIRGILFSTTSLPPGEPWFVSSPELLVRPVGAMFSLGIAVIAPALFVLLLVELVSMVAARVLPQMNVFFVAIPAKTAIGLATLASSTAFMVPVMGRAYGGIFTFWNEVLR